MSINKRISPSIWYNISSLPFPFHRPWIFMPYFPHKPLNKISIFIINLLCFSLVNNKLHEDRFLSVSFFDVFANCRTVPDQIYWHYLMALKNYLVK